MILDISAYYVHYKHFSIFKLPINAEKSTVCPLQNDRIKNILKYVVRYWFFKE